MSLGTIRQLGTRPEEVFDGDVVTRDMDTRTIRQGTISIISQGLVFILNIARITVLARLLAPDDFGLVGMVTVVVSFGTMFREAGLSTATIQKEHVTEQQVASLFWVNVAMSGFLGLAVVASAPLVALFFGRQELTSITIALALPFLLQGLSVQHRALLQRRMRFGALAIEQVFANVLALTTAVVLALHGARYWALVGGTTAYAAGSLLMVYFFFPWFPAGFRRGSNVRGMLRFGAHLTVFNFVNFFSRNADDILIGRFIDAQSLGFYSTAYRIVQVPLVNLRDPLTRVAVPACSRVQNDPKKLRALARTYTFVLAFAVMPLATLTFVLSEELILLLLGPKWTPVNPLFKIFALVAFLQAPANVKGVMLLSTGKSEQFMRQGAAVAIVNILSFVVGLNWGSVGVATAYAIAAYAIQLPAFWYTCRHTPLTYGDVTRMALQPAIASIASGVAVHYANTAIELENLYIKLAVTIPVFIISYLLVFSALPGGILTIRTQILDPLRRRLRPETDVR